MLFSQEVVEKLLYCFYVDDCLASVTSEEETVGLDRDLVSIRSKGGLELMKWMSCYSRGSKSKRHKRIRTWFGIDFPWRGVQWCVESIVFFSELHHLEH